MKLSNAGRIALKELEGVRLKTYKDVIGLKTIGIGHLLTKSELLSGKILIGGTTLRYAGGITLDEAEKILDFDLAPIYKALHDIPIPLTESQFDALAIFIFNIGLQAFKASKIFRFLQAGELEPIPTQMRRWVWAGGKQVAGLKKRREREIGLWEGSR